MKRFLTLVVFGALPTFALSLVNAPQAFADVKAVVTIECEPHFDTVAFADFSSSSPVQSPRPNALTPWFWTQPTSR